MNRNHLDILKVLRACTNGNLKTYVSDGFIYVTDTETGEVACIGNVNNKVDLLMKGGE